MLIDLDAIARQGLEQALMGLLTADCTSMVLSSTRSS
jgi:hypothetical protein